MPAWPLPPAAAATAARPSRAPDAQAALTPAERALRAYQVWSKSEHRGEPTPEARVAHDVLRGFNDQAVRLADLVAGGVELRMAARRVGLELPLAELALHDVHAEVARWLWIRLGTKPRGRRLATRSSAGREPPR